MKEVGLVAHLWRRRKRANGHALDVWRKRANGHAMDVWRKRGAYLGYLQVPQCGRRDHCLELWLVLPVMHGEAAVTKDVPWAVD